MTVARWFDDGRGCAAVQQFDNSMGESSATRVGFTRVMWHAPAAIAS